ncbi:alpha/beta fold hydrolase [Agrobacterium rhizogenes]|nr:alpha/beta fold hydrolase [Rhizobium rhizogenes]OCJ18826.1 alpha/beta hydrolase [Agrobacterium sp. B131/95]NTF76948.1 alpha/beta fold hydrolase [Rhizobium rhizogenes]NTF95665.1 alpha/beta fold hydrolase [Rhizobium rhizogenes]NTG62694.1 alpha/beta fold hydrolase [Rhizobium rhizogenes]
MFGMTKASKFGLVCLAVAAISSFASAAETKVSFSVDGQKVIGTLSTIDSNPKAPVVVMFHGFGGSRDELPIKDTKDGVFSRSARLLAESGYASLRIDFRGSGESDGKWADTTFSRQIKDGIAAVDWLKASDKVDGSKISILGWSQGGLVGAHVARARPEVKSVTLWAPVVTPLYTYGNVLGADNVAKGLTSPPDTEITARLPWGVDTTLKASFFKEMPTTSTIAAIAHYPGPLQVIVGSKDTTVTPQPASGQVLLDYHNGEERLDVFDMDHVFNAFTGPQTIDSHLVPATLEWLKKFNP